MTDWSGCYYHHDLIHDAERTFKYFEGNIKSLDRRDALGDLMQYKKEYGDAVEYKNLIECAASRVVSARKYRANLMKYKKMALKDLAAIKKACNLAATKIDVLDDDEDERKIYNKMKKLIRQHCLLLNWDERDRVNQLCHGNTGRHWTTYRRKPLRSTHPTGVPGLLITAVNNYLQDFKPRWMREEARVKREASAVGRAERRDKRNKLKMVEAVNKISGGNRREDIKWGGITF